MTRALISVADKTGVVVFARSLSDKGIEIVSTGGTKKTLEAAGIAVLSIEEVTGFPEMMDGRVKTLHPKIHGALLGRREVQSHVEAMEYANIQPIDYVCVNLYPFKETIKKTGVVTAEAIENIDIGGPSMLRSAAKNYSAVTAISDPTDYPRVMAEIEQFGETTLETRQKLAAKVFRHTAAYDAFIAEYMTELAEEQWTEQLTLTFEHKQTLRYGENNHQLAGFYQSPLPAPYSIACAKQLHGKELSYNNIRDADAALRIVREYTEPTVVALKHMNPCGIGTAETIEKAWDYAYEADPISIFGGIIVLNREVDQSTAAKMQQLFLEIILAPAYTPEALAILKGKKNLRLLQLDFSQKNQDHSLEFVSVLGGVLVQEQDQHEENPTDWTVVTERQPSVEERKALEFAWKAVKHVKSNAIVVANASQTLGIGAGQMNRIGSVKIALEQAKEHLDGAVLASDAFFPMADSVEYAAKHGIKAIIQPGGSIKDQESIDKANQYGIAMIFTGFRHFRH